MKKITIIGLGILALASCTKQINVIEDGKAVEYGTFSMNMTTSQDIIASKAVAEATDDYNVIISQGATEVKNQTYGELKTPFPMATGTYNILAQNITEAAAVEGRGAQRFAGSNSFNINAGQTTSVTVACSMTNTRISLTYSEEFKQVFTNVNVTVYESSDAAVQTGRREVSFDANATIEDTATWAYFNIDSDPEITLVINATRSDGELKTYTKKQTVAAKNWHKITIKPSTTNGQADLNITVDDTLVEEDINTDIDPYL